MLVKRELQARSRGGDEVIGALCRAAQAVAHDMAECRGIGVGVPGLIDSSGRWKVNLLGGTTTT